MKAGKSSDTAMVLPSFVTNALLVSNVASSVAIPRISSTSSISGTGIHEMNADEPLGPVGRGRKPSLSR